MEELLSRAAARAIRQAGLEVEQLESKVEADLRDLAFKCKEEAHELQMQVSSAATRNELVERREEEGRARERESHRALEEERARRTHDLQTLRESTEEEGRATEARGEEEQVMRVRGDALEQCRVANRAKDEAEMQVRQLQEELAVVQGARENALNDKEATLVALRAAEQSLEATQRAGAEEEGSRREASAVELEGARVAREEAIDQLREAKDALFSAARETDTLRQTVLTELRT
ncbi:hypothetical protein T484DRAFT_2714791 [Baffinella frigidus]|nr:hypothetical protein T484DRAFT_2714791 [Cryptophyta sp. CCMP2293]